MNQNTIIKALSEKIERLESENNSLKMPPIQMALNTVFDINRESIVDFETKNVSPSNHYVILSMEFLEGIEQENERLKARTELFERIIDDKQKEYEFLNKNAKEEVKSLIAENERLKMENESFQRLEKIQTEEYKELSDFVLKNHNILEERRLMINEINALKKEKIENGRFIASLNSQSENFRRLLEDMPQWKNSEKDGMPVLKIGEKLVYKYENDTCSKLFELKTDYFQKFMPVGGNFEYFIIPENNAIN